MHSLRGHLLISSGGLFDPNFRHTVVLIGDHGDDGALGVVLNRRLDIRVAETVPGLSTLVAADARLYQGGPVQPQSPVLLAQLDHPELADLPVFGSIGFLIGEIEAEIRSEIRQARVFAGYSGWGPGQLEGELAEHSWIIEPAREEDVFTDDPETLWSRVLQRKGPGFDLMSEIPFDPRMN
jgi:putative transcriptional regulator